MGRIKRLLEGNEVENNKKEEIEWQFG